MTPSSDLNIAVIGGGAAGYFAALRAAELLPGARICIFEAGKRPLEKVRVSGGGRCNVTHQCFEPARLVEGYPRGSKELRGPFHHFQPQDTVNWFKERGVTLKVEQDGRMFPDTDSSETIIECLEAERARLGVDLRTQSRVTAVESRGIGEFALTVEKVGESKQFRSSELIMLATGSNKSGYAIAASCGHRITDLVPSLFTFVVEDAALHSLAGISVADVTVELVIDGREISAQHGALLITHWGLSGPAILKLSAFAARELYASHYTGTLRVDFTSGLRLEEVRSKLLEVKAASSRKKLLNVPLFDIPIRLWQYLLRLGLSSECERSWADANNDIIAGLAKILTASEFVIAGKGQFKEEFVTCGGVATEEVDFRTMESKRCAGLFLGGEILNIDGITGGYNFQNAWTTGWLAGSEIGKRLTGQS